MSFFEGFIGGSASERVGGINRERTINFYPCLADSGFPKATPYLQHTPGLKPFVVLSDGPIRALFYQDGRLFAVGANLFYEILATHTYIPYGAVAVDGRPATISSNGTAGHQLFITSGGQGYIFDLVANTFSPIIDPDFITPCVMGTFVDGYFISLGAATATPTATASHAFQLSDLFDGTSWSGLDVAQVSQMSDELMAMWTSHRELWFFGSKHTQVWADIGAANFPFAPVPGALLDYGLAGAYAVGQIDNSLFWIGQNESGSRMVYRAEGYAAKRISTHALEFYLSQTARLDDVVAYTYQEEGHAFVHFLVPGLPTSPVYDVAGPPKMQWHERAAWDDVLLRWRPHVSRCHAFAFGKHLVGARNSSAVYEMSLDFTNDALVVFP